jgi:hypothetical protein
LRWSTSPSIPLLPPSLVPTRTNPLHSPSTLCADAPRRGAAKTGQVASGLQVTGLVWLLLVRLPDLLLLVGRIGVGALIVLRRFAIGDGTWPLPVSIHAWQYCTVEGCRREMLSSSALICINLALQTAIYNVCEPDWSSESMPDARRHRGGVNF